jgi:hypothetical protein
MTLLLISGAVLICVLVWVALTSSEAGQQRDGQVERDYDLRRERRWPWSPSRSWPPRSS